MENYEKKLPINSVISFRYLVDYWKTLSKECCGFYTDFAEMVIKEASFLNDYIENEKELADNNILIETLLTLIFPVASRETMIAAVFKPFSYQCFSYTPAFERLLGNKMEISEEEIEWKIAYAYAFVLNSLYGFNFSMDIPIVRKLSCAEHTLCRSYKMSFDMQFCRVEKISEVPDISPEERKIIEEEFPNMEFLRKKIPIENFRFIGFIVMNAFDITVQELISEVKKDLLDKTSIISHEKFQSIENKIRSLLSMNDVQYGIAAIKDTDVYMLNSSIKMNNDCIYLDSNHFKIDDFSGSFFEKAFQSKQPVIVGDISKIQSPSIVEKEMIKEGMKSAMIIPLIIHERIVGAIAVTSAVPYRFKKDTLRVLDELISIFAVAVNNSLEDLENNISFLIQEKFTSIHPSVAWKFNEAAMGFLDGRKSGDNADIKPILFDRVYPLYAVTDIRGSSLHRNLAIKEDLSSHLLSAREIVFSALSKKALPILDEITFRIDRFLDNMKDGIDTGDEIKIIRFLKNDVEGSFEEIREFSPELMDRIDDYFRGVEKEYGSFYRERKKFDDSVQMINKAVSEYIDRAELEAQKMYPHYFDRQITDGVDMSIYIGASIAKGRKFDRIHLKNMRLWQFIVICNIAVCLEKNKQRMPIPLETTHLIVVQDMPITIRFDMDEKRFRVDGAYNTRYEIMKKRIDKAVIKETGERLTRPGTVAIVYSQDMEIEEYFEYVEYLKDRKYLMGDVERFELDEMQGIRGLKALRCQINLARTDEDPLYLMKSIESFSILN